MQDKKTLEDQIEKIKSEFNQKIADVSELNALDNIRVEFLGREQGRLNLLRRSIKDFEPSDRPLLGQLINVTCNEVEELLNARQKNIEHEERNKQLESEKIDVTLPSRKMLHTGRHPLSMILEEMLDIFTGMGYTTAEGPEIETEHYNFHSLNFPKDHPAMDMQATFYVDKKDSLLLRTHTSPVQVRVMEKEKPPIQIIAPGRVYRRDAITRRHSPVFNQVEGLLVARDVTFGDLKGTLIKFIHEMFGKTLKVKFSPSFFPFTEPSTEVCMECFNCRGSGCQLCSKTGWFEILGAGMIDPNVFRAVGYDPEEYSGFAFGMGLDRIAIVKYQIDDIRLFYMNDLSFLQQFN